MEKINKILPAQLFSQIMQICFGVMFISLLISGCTGLSRISEGQYLVAEYQIDLGEKDEIYHYKETKNQLRDEISKDPNGKFLWMRPRLALHNTIAEPTKEKGLKYWLKYKLGKAPVLLDERYCQNLNVTFENRLYHKGHFNATSTFTIERKNKTAIVKYQIDAQQAYRIDTLILPDADDTLSNAMHALQQNSLIIKDEIYQLQSLKRERVRIDNELKNMGFYYFNPDYIGFLADTTDGDHKVKLKLELKDDTPKDGTKVFSIGKISVAEDFRLENYHPDTSMVENYRLISSSHYMKPKYFLNSVLYDSGSYYSKQTHSNSVKQLMGLRSYKYVNAKYSPSPEFDDKLDVTYMMTPSPKMSVSTELNAVTKSNSFAGPGLKLTYNSKNFFRGAELFSINFTGRFEKQVSKEQSDTAYELSIDANLDFPRIIPFRIKKKDHPYLPNSNIVLGAGVFSRLSLYRFNTLTTGLGYSWRKNESLTHAFKPIDISVTNLVDATDDFEDFLEQNPSIRKSFEEQFIVGSVYNITLNKLGEANLRRFYISFGVDPSGNLISALVSLFGNSENDTKATAKIFGQQISQYSRGRLDLRYYFNLGKEAYLATKFYSGVGVPYGQSEVMPYVKQFYAGGTNSLRAFRARSLGPGAYIPASDSLENVLVDQTGDIKLEANIEYRFPIVGFLKGAVFSDIGNIWLVNEDPLRPEGKFYLKTFHKQLAVGLGFGLRIDVSLMVLRFDWAFPIRKPWLPEGERWVFDDIDLLNHGWRKDNLLWNISIGYPF
jgi:outer membrane protein assembly factor BamA